jgi:hypothetical protein
VYTSNITYGGTVQGGGRFLDGEKVTLIAQAVQGSEFVAWIKNNKKVSDKASYQFDATKEVAGSYTAVFKSQTPTYYTPVAIAFFAQEKDNPELEGQPIVLDNVTFNFKSSNFSNVNLIHEESKLEFLLQDTLQSSMIYEFEPDVFLKIQSGNIHKQTYDFSFEITLIINEEKTLLNNTMSLSITEMQDNTDSYGAEYKYISITILDENNINFSGYAWLAPAGVELDSSNFSTDMK